MAKNSSTNRLRNCVQTITKAISSGKEQKAFLNELETALADLVVHDDWLPEAFSIPGADTYRQYLLYCDPLERFSIVSFVWAAGQETPIHDHTIWGAIGQLRGEEISTAYRQNEAGEFQPQTPETSKPGDVILFTPEEGDIHKVINPGPDMAISIHIYGTNIGRVTRSTFDAVTGAPSPFVSGYSNDAIPNIWCD